MQKIGHAKLSFPYPLPGTAVDPSEADITLMREVHSQDLHDLSCNMFDEPRMALALAHVLGWWWDLYDTALGPKAPTTARNGISAIQFAICYVLLSDRCAFIFLTPFFLLLTLSVDI